jgi:hypothetical protein
MIVSLVTRAALDRNPSCRLEVDLKFDDYPTKESNGSLINYVLAGPRTHRVPHTGFDVVADKRNRAVAHRGVHAVVVTTAG